MQPLHFFAFPDVKSENTDEIERIEGFTSCCLCYQTFTFTSTTSTRNIPSHSCVKNLLNTKITTYTRTASSSPQIKRGSMMNNYKQVKLNERELNTRARYGEFNLNNALRGADTISNHIYNLADECRTQLNEIIHEPLGSGAIYVSPDLWSDNHRKISYLGMLVTFVDDKFVYYIVALSCKPFIGDNQAAENLLINDLNKDIQANGGVSLKQSTIIRWLSLIHLLKKKLKNIDEYVLKQLICLLQPFKQVLQLVQQGDSPSLYMVLPCVLSLKKALSSFDELLKHQTSKITNNNEEDNDENTDKESELLTES
ncbi:unnamed protein product [Rotaria sordida]|uniref:Uncharacterized protein n=1 Tax=Rotaria sordida TaxID=392033 RepID=A0A819FU81_9BILA|nr:unnamed protein product [Rotaria sordida]CAF3969651.1 unnamed protein product [Rotaria sordida]